MEILDIFKKEISLAKKSSVFLVLAGIAYASFYTIESGTVGVLSTMGRYNPEPVLPGLHFKIPVIQKIKIFDVKMHAANYKTNKDLPDSSGVFNKPLIRVLDTKNLPIGIELTIQFTPNKAEAPKILTVYGDYYFEKLINPIARDIIRDVIGKYQAEEIARDRSKINGEIVARLKDKFKTLPFELNEVLLRDIKLPDVVMNKIKEVQIAKQEEQKLAMIEKQAEKKQRIKTIEANTRLIEVTTNAKAEAEKKRIAADAKAYQIAMEANATARANKLIASSLTPELIRYEWTKQWKGVVPSTFLGSESDKNILLNIKK